MHGEAVPSELSEGGPTAVAHPRAKGLGVVYTEAEESEERRAKLFGVPSIPHIGRAVKGTASLPAGDFYEDFGEDGDGMGRGSEGGDRTKRTTRRSCQVSLRIVGVFTLHEGSRFDNAPGNVVVVRGFGKAFW